VKVVHYIIISVSFIGPSLRTKPAYIEQQWKVEEKAANIYVLTAENITNWTNISNIRWVDFVKCAALLKKIYFYSYVKQP